MAAGKLAHQVEQHFGPPVQRLNGTPFRQRVAQVRMLYVGRLHNGTRPEVRHMRDARLEAGRLQRMRHARAQVPHEPLFYLRAGGVPTRHTQGRPR